jgi:diguanylate cyclase (GGDEF)-like protein
VGFTTVIVVLLLTVPVLVCLHFASRQEKGRMAWTLVAVGLAFNAVGEAYFYFVERSLTTFPTVGDVFCLALFPPLVAGVVLLVRSRHECRRLSIWVDGGIVALAIGALSYELIFDTLLGGAAHSGLLVAGQLAYPILDLAVLTMLWVICIPSRFRVGSAYYWLIAGIAVLLATDVANVRDAADGVNSPGTLLGIGWAVAIVLIATASRFDATLVRSSAFRGWRLHVALGGAMLLSIGMLLEGASDGNSVVTSMAAAALLLGMWRLFRTLNDNSRLLEERDETIAKQRAMQVELRFLADHDPLTGLFNRRRFQQRVKEQLRYAHRYGRAGAVLLIDLDSFKFVNDSFGHPVGDEVIRRVAKALEGSLRASDVAARLGGDEFAVLLPEAGEEGALEVAEHVLGAIKAGREPSISACLGIALFDGPDGPSSSIEDLFVAADVALYEAKAAGNGGVGVFRGERGHRLAWVDRIRDALSEDRLVLYAQPIVDLSSGEVAREELLIRMIDRDGTEIPPSSFLPTAERFGLMAEIDRFVVGRGIELARGGRAVAANISGPSLTDGQLIDEVAEAIREGMDPGLLSFELTETAGVVNIDAARRFAGYLENLGIELALDDFGTGLSSLESLRRIPIQTLKIDVEFVRGMGSSPFDRYLVQTIIGLARRLGQKTVAEGVEDAGTLSLLRTFGVDYAQGFLLGAPAPIDSDGPHEIESSVRGTLEAAV